ncbi:MAG TPA: hypothetical protein PLK12_02435, partial [Prolixibacteraceae bacterium]|nr:hypothetical protein [Prolixibacteraceae bacterium]
MNFRPEKIGSLFLSLIFVGLLFYYFFYNPTYDFQPGIPGMDNRGKGLTASMIINIGEFFERFDSDESLLPESWPRFRGADYDNISKSNLPLVSRFENGAGDPLWQHE